MTPQLQAVPLVAEKSKGGRPTKRQTAVVSVRLPELAYDAYIKMASRTGEDVRTIMRAVLTRYAPKEFL